MWFISNKSQQNFAKKKSKVKLKKRNFLADFIYTAKYYKCIRDDNILKFLNKFKILNELGQFLFYFWGKI